MILYFAVNAKSLKTFDLRLLICFVEGTCQMSNFFKDLQAIQKIN
jgi:hypothetical protein